MRFLSLALLIAFTASLVALWSERRRVAPIDREGGLVLIYQLQDPVAAKRDAVVEDLRDQLAMAVFAGRRGGTPTASELQSLRNKAVLIKPDGHPNTFSLEIVDDRSRESVLAAWRRLVRRDDLVCDEFSASLTCRLRDDFAASVRDHATQQAGIVVRNRLAALRMSGSTVDVAHDQLRIAVTSRDPAVLSELRQVIPKPNRLVLMLLDDDVDPFAGVESSEALSLQTETIPVGEGKHAQIHFLRGERSPGEDARTARKRFDSAGPRVSLPAGDVLRWGEEQRRSSATPGWRSYLLYDRAELTGDQVEDAVAQSDATGSSVRVTLARAGAQRFEDLTRANVKRRVAIVLDDEVLSAPVIQTPIGGGRLTITMGAGPGEEQATDARRLALALRSGALPAPLELTSEFVWPGSPRFQVGSPGTELEFAL